MLHQVNIHLVIIHFVSLFFFYFGAGNCSCRCRCSSQAAGSKSESTNLKKILDEKQKQAVVLTQSSVSLQSVQKQDPASAATADSVWVFSGQTAAFVHKLVSIPFPHINSHALSPHWRHVPRSQLGSCSHRYHENQNKLVLVVASLAHKQLSIFSLF